MSISVSHPKSTISQYQPLRLILESLVDMGCHTNFAMYYSICLNHFNINFPQIKRSTFKKDLSIKSILG